MYVAAFELESGPKNLSIYPTTLPRRLDRPAELRTALVAQEVSPGSSQNPITGHLHSTYPENDPTLLVLPGQLAYSIILRHQQGLNISFARSLSPRRDATT
jgi:hypothetical protein